jgi:hypothetical protein
MPEFHYSPRQNKSAYAKYQQHHQHLIGELRDEQQQQQKTISAIMRRTA